MGRRRGDAIYVQIASDYRALILSGEWPPGHVIGIEKDLALAEGVGLHTIGATLDILKAEGLIDRVQGQPATVRHMPDDKVVVSVQRGSRITYPFPTPEQVAELGCPPGQRIAVVTTGAKVNVYSLETTEFDVK